MLEFIDPQEVSAVYKTARAESLIDEHDTALIFYSRKLLLNRLDHLKKEFGRGVHHTVAIKTQNTAAVLRAIIGYGFGLEAASREEIEWAMSCGLEPTRIVFDSPAKTRAEIRWCEKNCAGMITNANCVDELARYSDDSPLHIGLRINPEVHVDAPGVYNVSRAGSKFGEPLSNRQRIVEAALQKPLITGLHVHVGSGIDDFSGNIKAIEKVVDLASAIDFERSRKKLPPLTFIDIGGGVLAKSADIQSGLTDFAQNIRKRLPELFDRYEVLTEFGRFVHTDNAFTVSNVEYILPGSGDASPTAILHVGADMFLRRAYADADNAHDIAVLSPEGDLKTDRPTHRINLAGPLCFAGDYLYRDIDLPTVVSGDKIVLLQSGANNTAMWSRHCSRDIPKLLTYDPDDMSFAVAHKRTPVQLL